MPQRIAGSLVVLLVVAAVATLVVASARRQQRRCTFPLARRQCVQLAAAESYAGSVCGGQVPTFEWDQTGPPVAVAWVISVGGDNCDPPIIHMLSSYWHNGNANWLAGRGWPEYCTVVVHEYVHFTGLNWHGQAETPDPTSVEYDGGGARRTRRTVPCGRPGQQLWPINAPGEPVQARADVIGNPRIPAAARS